MTKERWKDIDNYEGFYQVSTLGRVRSIPRNHTKGKILKPSRYPNGYLKIALSKKAVVKERMIHRLVAETFVKKGFGKEEVNHKNRIKTDNTLANLEWVTKRENAIHYGKSVNKTSRYPGVSWNKRSSRWEVWIMFRRISYYLGKYRIEKEAASRYTKIRHLLETLPNTAPISEIKKITFRTPTRIDGLFSSGSKLTKQKLTRIRKLLTQNRSDQSIADIVGCNRMTVNSIKLKKTYLNP